MAFSFSYRGIRAEDIGLEVQDVVRSILPPSELRTVEIPNRAGNIFQRSDFGMSKIDIDVFIIGTSLANAQSIQRDVADFLNPRNGLGDLILDDETDKKYEAVIGGETNIRQILELKRGTITFIIPDSFAISVNEELETLDSNNIATFSRNSDARDEPIFILHEPHEPRYLEDQDSQFIEDTDVDIQAGAQSKQGLDDRNEAILIERGTENLLTVNQSNLQDGTTGYVAKSGGVISQVFINQDGHLRLEAGASGEGFLSDFVPLNTTGPFAITFSAYIANNQDANSGPWRLILEEYDNTETLLNIAVSTDVTLDKENQDFRRYGMTQTSPNASTTQVKVGIEQNGEGITDILYDNAQVEIEEYATNWTRGDTARENELLEIPEFAPDDAVSEGTLAIWFTRVANSTDDFSAILDRGIFDAGNNQDRMVIFHNTNGIGLDKVQFQIVTGSTAETTTITLTSAAGDFIVGEWWLAILRWRLNEDSESQVEADLFNSTTGETLNGALLTTQPAPDFSAFDNYFVGTTRGGDFWVNGLYNDLTVFNRYITDIEVSQFQDGSKRIPMDNTVVQKYSFTGTLYPSILNEGTALTPSIIEVIAGDQANPFTVTHNESGNSIVQNSVDQDDTLVINNEISLITKNGLNDMAQLDISSKFFSFVNQENSLAITTTGATELLTDSQQSAEDDISGFNAKANTTITRTIGEAFSGTASLRVEVTSDGTSDEGFETTDVPVDPNTTYTYSIYLKGDVGGELVELELDQLDESASFITETQADEVSLKNAWQHYSMTFTTQANTRFIEVGVDSNDPNNIVFFADDLSVEEKGKAHEIDIRFNPHYL